MQRVDKTKAVMVETATSLHRNTRRSCMARTGHPLGERAHVIFKTGRDHRIQEMQRRKLSSEYLLFSDTWTNERGNR